MRFCALVLVFVFSTNALAEDTAKGAAKKLVVIGDSLSEGYGVAKEKAWPSLLEKKLAEAKKNYSVVNAGVSGSTSASAGTRMSWQLKSKPALIILALGANDGLRGLSVKFMEENLSKSVEMAKKAEVKIILAGMMLPPNYGKDYVKDFAAAFPRVAEKHKIPLIPFLLDKVGGKADLNLTDGIHPNEKGHEIIAETVFKAIEKEI